MTTLRNSISRTLLRVALPALAAMTLAACACDAGSSEDSKGALELHGRDYVQAFANEVNLQLDTRKANVALIARCGRLRKDMPRGIEFTHVGIAVFEAVKRDDGRVGHTYSVYNLYQGLDGDKGKSHLVQDFTFDMCAGAVEPEIGVIIPSPALQARLLAAVRSPAYAAMHNVDYNLIANPAVDQYDNCVTHTLKILFAAIYQTDEETRVYENIRRYFEPESIRLSIVERIGAQFMSDIHTADQRGRNVKTATFGSLRRFLEKHGLMEDYFIVRMEPPAAANNAPAARSPTTQGRP